MSKVTRRLTNKQPVDPVRRLFEDLNQPSEARLKQALRARQIPFTDEEVAKIVKGSTANKFLLRDLVLTAKWYQHIKMLGGQQI